MRNDINNFSDDKRDADAKDWAPEAKHNGLDGKVYKDATVTHAESFVEANFARALLNRH